MSRAGIIALLAVIALGAVATEPAQARGGRQHHHHHYYGHRPSWHLGVFFGAPLAWYYASPYYYYPPAYYYPPVYSYPPVVVARPSPPVYIERGDAAPESGHTQDYWYYCPEARAYYPYVKQCAKGWRKVPAQPQ